jgi:flagellar operon protein
MNEPIQAKPVISVQPIQVNQTHKPATNGTAANTFAEALQQAQNIRFSNHAQKRLETRNITLSDDGINRLNDAVNKAQKRGGKESLVLMDDLAFVVNIKDRTVVTAMDAHQRGDGVFTQIDSVVFAEPGNNSGNTKKVDIQS